MLVRGTIILSLENVWEALCLVIYLLVEGAGGVKNENEKKFWSYFFPVGSTDLGQKAQMTFVSQQEKQNFKSPKKWHLIQLL